MAITPEELAALPVGQRFTVGSACPRCQLRNVITVIVALIAKDQGTYSLAGTQDKLAVHRGYWATCENCGWEGEFGPKTSGDPA